jgi:Tol biopolymer transport system component
MINSRKIIALIVILVITVSCVNKLPIYTQIGNQSGLYENPAWSPDGGRIIFQFTPLGQSIAQLVTARSDGGDWSMLNVSGKYYVSRSNLVWLDEDKVLYVNRYNGLVFHNLKDDTETFHSVGNTIVSISVNSTKDKIAMAVEARLNHFSLIIYDIKTGNTASLIDGSLQTGVNSVAWDPKSTHIVYSVAQLSQQANTKDKLTIEIIGYYSAVNALKHCRSSNNLSYWIA